MPELTVAMPAHNAGHSIEAAVSSVLCQQGVDFELIVVDDASTDDTGDAVDAYRDPRITLLRNPRPMGVAHCLNVVINHSHAPFICHVGADDVILPEALRTMVEALKRSSQVGQAFCYSFPIGKHGEVFRSTYTSIAQNVYSLDPSLSDAKRDVIVGAMDTSVLPTYRRQALYDAGDFHPALPISPHLEMTLRILQRYDVQAVPELLCARGYDEPNNTKRMRQGALHACWHMYRICRRLTKQRQVSYLSQPPYQLNRFIIRRLWKTLTDQLCFTWFGKLFHLGRALRRWWQWTIRRPFGASFYGMIGRWGPNWPLDVFTAKRRKRHPRSNERIAYYLGWFPVLSETFIQREVGALKQRRGSIEVFADEAHGAEFFDETARAFMTSTHYLHPLDDDVLRQLKTKFFRKHPLRYVNAFLFVLTHRYNQFKTFEEDRATFSKAVYLAGRFAEQQIRHVHAPWANKPAFIALIAAKLLGLSFSVQGRAFDLHRRDAAFALTEKFAQAAFIITNTQYNANHIRDAGISEAENCIRVIYNGIDLSRFSPMRRPSSRDQRIRFLCVARLAEQKGLLYLLQACRILKENGQHFQCHIIGAPVKPQCMNYYIDLKRQYHALQLERHVIFMGPQPFDRILQAYDQADIFVLPCVIGQDGSRDIIPNVLIEAMAMQLPVVSTTVTGIPEIVDDGIDGLLVPPQDGAALAAAMRRLMEDEGLRLKLGEQARHKVEERFDIRKNITQYVSLFKPH